MQRRTRLAVVGLLLALSPGGNMAQVEVHQGPSAPSDLVNFASPMVLDLRVPSIARVPFGSQLQLPDVRKYVCDRDVSLLNLTITKNRKSRRDEQDLLLMVSGAVLVANSYDRRVDIELRLKAADQVLVSQTLKNLSTEEERSTPFTVTLPITDAALRGAFTPQRGPTLEVTLTVRNDS